MVYASNGQLPAYEWTLVMLIHPCLGGSIRLNKMYGRADKQFLERVFPEVVQLYLVG